MWRKSLSLVLCMGLSGASSWAQPAIDPEIAKGIKQVEDGDYDAAILTLDTAARHLSADPSKSKDLSQAYLYLGIAYVGKGHDAAAKAKFREAIAQIKDLSLSPDKFSPRVINVFEEAKEEEAKNPAPAPTAEKKGGSHKGLLIGVGVAAAAGIGIAAASGGGDSTPSTTLPADPRKTETFTGTICSYNYQQNNGGCETYVGRDIVVSKAGNLEATVTWTNNTHVFSLVLQDQNYTDIARSNRTTSTLSTLNPTAVTPQTACSSCAYHISVYREDEGGPEDYTLTVKHP